MKSANILIFAVVALAGAISFAADLTYKAKDDVHSWDTASAWSGGALPTADDIVRLDDSSIAIPDYLRVTNNVTAYAKELHIGASATDGDGLVGLKVEPGGTLNLTANSHNNHFFVGNKGRGSLVIDGGTMAVSGWNLVVGKHAGSYGEVTINPGSSTFTPTEQGAGNWNKGLIVGFDGTGRLTTFADLGYFYGKTAGLELRVGANTAGWSSFFAGECTVNTYDCQIGGMTYYSDRIGDTTSTPTAKPGFGEMVLSNATLKVAEGLPANTDAQLRIGRYVGGYGILRGCGVVQGSALDSNNVRIWLNEGQVIADGFGEEKLLDMNTVVSIRNNTTTTASDTTNGWYAVNKGAVLFPRTYFESASASTMLGEWTLEGAPRFVNSVGVSLSGVAGSGGRFLRGGFFASDRSDIHADSLPSGQTIVGVWKLGITSSLQGTTDVQSYTSASLDFRYDQSKVKTGDMLSLYRWTGSAWSRETSKTADSTYRISVSGLEAPASRDGIYNIGTFALLAKSTVGLTIIVK